jgi:asparagine synthase (glutamine-hydrolysing)
MCGITGLLNKTKIPVDKSELQEMTERLHHRGPDASGIFLKDNVGLGIKRLSIIDLSEQANQPMFNEDGSIVIVFNGEIYNYKELMKILRAKGHRFTSQSDTEVIVHAWEEYGVDCVLYFRGMFAFALYDINKKKIFIARDRLGKKPLFYYSDQTQFIFASEIKAIKSVPGTDMEISINALCEYAAYGYSLGEDTIYKNIHRLLPAHYITIDLNTDNFNLLKEQYWNIKIKPDYRLTEEDWLDEMDKVLSDAVHLRMTSDVPLGAFLSGGIDSSLVAAYMTRHNPGGVKTFTIGFKEDAYDESGNAAAIARHLKTDHHCEIVTPSALEILPDLVDTYDEPFADSSAIPTFILCKLTRRHVTVVLSGDGGDEFFLGYPRYPLIYKSYILSQRITRFGRGMSRLISRALPYGKLGKRSLERLSMSEFDQYNHAMGYSAENLGLLRDTVLNSLPVSDEGKMNSDFWSQQDLSLLERYQYSDIVNYLPEDILVKVDRASMQHSLEVRCPLLDQEFVELAARIPHEMKLSGFNGKMILKKLAQKYIPKEMLDRPKKGFGVPLGQWFKGELASSLRGILADTGNPMWDYYDRKRVTKRVFTHLGKKVDSSAVLWRLLYFHRWCQKYLE